MPSTPECVVRGCDDSCIGGGLPCDGCGEDAVYAADADGDVGLCHVCERIHH